MHRRRWCDVFLFVSHFQIKIDVDFLQFDLSDDVIVSILRWFVCSVFLFVCFANSHEDRLHFVTRLSWADVFQFARSSRRAARLALDLDLWHFDVRKLFFSFSFFDQLTRGARQKMLYSSARLNIQHEMDLSRMHQPPARRCVRSTRVFDRSMFCHEHSTCSSLRFVVGVVGDLSLSQTRFVAHLDGQSEHSADDYVHGCAPVGDARLLVNASYECFC